MTRRRTDPGRILFVLALAAVLAAGAVLAADFAVGSRFFPMAVSALGAVFCLIIAVLLAFFPKPEGAALDASTESAPPPRAALFFAGVLAYLGSIYLVGFLAATVLGLVVFLRFVARAPIRIALVIGALTLGTIALLGTGLDIYWPEGVLPKALS